MNWFRIYIMFFKRKNSFQFCLYLLYYDCCCFANEGQYEPHREKTYAYAKTKAQISLAVTAKLISAFVFATGIVQFLFYLNPKFKLSSFLL